MKQPQNPLRECLGCGQEVSQMEHQLQARENTSIVYVVSLQYGDRLFAYIGHE